MKFDQDLCLKCDMIPRWYFGKMNSILGSVVPLAMFILFITKIIITKMKRPLDSIETQRGFMWSGAKGLGTVDKL